MTDEALDWLFAADAAYTHCLTALHQLRTVETPAQLSAATDAVLSHANATCRGRPIFGGATAGATAYDESGTYLGDAGAMLYTVAPRTTIDLAMRGPDVFGDVFGDIFVEMRKISALPVPPATLDRLDAVAERVRAAHGSSAEVRRRLLHLAMARNTSDAERERQPQPLAAIDTADLVARVAAAEVTYRASARTLSDVERESLREFLR